VRRTDTAPQREILSSRLTGRAHRALDRNRQEFRPAPEQHVSSQVHIQNCGVAADYVDVELKARKGPLGTANYRISLEAVGLENERAFVHLQYSYTYGFVGRLAMKTYLATSGSEKVGFTLIGDSSDPEPKFIGGVRGAIERNTMRYYLAIDAYLGALATPAPARFEQSLERWFSATELYPRQLREIGRDAYFAMKRSEYRRQQTAQ